MTETDFDSHEGIQELNSRLEVCANGMAQKVAENNYYSANEEAFVSQQLLEMSKNTNPAELTPERVELMERLAWAMSELRYGHAARVPDDLEGVEELAQEVYEQ